MKQFLLSLALVIGFMLPVNPTGAMAITSLNGLVISNQATATIESGYQNNNTVFGKKLVQKRLFKKVKKAFSALDDDGQLVAILAYITSVGFLIALVIHFSGNKTSLGGYHLAQSLGLFILGLVAGVSLGLLAIIPFVGWIIGLAICVLLLINLICGIINAVNGEEKPMPILGKQFAKAFGRIFE